MVAPIIALRDTADVGRRSGLYLSVIAPAVLAGPPSQYRRNKTSTVQLADSSLQYPERYIP